LLTSPIDVGLKCQMQEEVVHKRQKERYESPKITYIFAAVWYTGGRGSGSKRKGARDG